MDSTTSIITLLIIVIAFATTTIFTQLARRGRFFFRGITAYNQLPIMVGAAIESDRTVHVSFGSAGIGGTQTALALASAEVFYQTARRAAMGNRTPVATLSDPSAIPLAYSALYRAYASRGKADQARYAGVRWIPGGERSLAFAAGLIGVQSTDRVYGNVLVGSFGAEMALILDTVNRRGGMSIAGSDQLVGQAAAFVLADHPLIGEEMFVSGAYLDDSKGARGAVVALDTMRFFLIVALLGGVALVLANSGALSSITGGR